MTNAEAIKELSYIADEMSSMECADWKEAISVAIKALEQEPCDDAISRQYLIEKATNWEKHFHDSERYVSLTDIQNAPPVKPQEPNTGHLTALEEWKNDFKGFINELSMPKDDYNGIMEYIDEVPNEPKIGHWVEENINEGCRKVFCSECGCPPPFEHISTGDVYSASGYGVINKTKYCPNCGARMESEEKHE